jgi:hypothetical protein
MSNNTHTGQAFLGVGLAFPLQLDAQGHIATRSLEEQVQQSIQLILRTSPGERVMRPEFGAGLQKLIFAPLTTTTATLAQQAVEEALLRYEPRIEVLAVEAQADPQGQNRLLINIQYRLRQTDAVFNLVYPFYLERGEL